MFISGGEDSIIYNETLTIEVNGKPGDLVTIRNGLDSGHNGKVIIDVPDVGIKITNKRYVRITNLYLMNVGRGVYVRGSLTGDVNVVYLDSLFIQNYKKQGGIAINGWSRSGLNATVDSVFIRFCTISTSYPTNSQTDVIYAQYCNNLYILNNDLTVISNMEGSHTDAIQFVHKIKNITVANNNINNLTSSEVNSKSNGVMGADLIGSGYFYNNVVYTPYFKKSGNNVFMYTNGTTPDKAGSWFIYNNVFIGGGTVKLFSIEDKDVRIKNNIFYSITPGTGQLFIKVPLDDWSRLDYNLYGQNNGIKENKIINFEGLKSMNQMRNFGAELHGVNQQDPLFVIPFIDLHLQRNSPAIKSGVNLGSNFNKDKMGIERPENDNWDIGCYQNIYPK